MSKNILNSLEYYIEKVDSEGAYPKGSDMNRIISMNRLKNYRDKVKGMNMLDGRISTRFSEYFMLKHPEFNFIKKCQKT